MPEGMKQILEQLHKTAAQLKAAALAIQSLAQQGTVDYLIATLTLSKTLLMERELSHWLNAEEMSEAQAQGYDLAELTCLPHGAAPEPAEVVWEE